MKVRSVRSLRPVFVTIAVLAASLGATVARADTIFSDFSTRPGALFDCCSAYNDAGASYFGAPVVLADAFVASGDFTLTQIDLALLDLGRVDSSVIQLAGDNAGTPGTVLEEWDVTNVQRSVTCCALEILVSNTPVSFTSGSQYWVILGPGSADAETWWNLNDIGATGLIAGSNGGAWREFNGRELATFDVLGNPSSESSAVPEPSTLLLVGSGLALAGHRRKRSQ